MEREKVMVEGVECVYFPIPANTQDDPLDDAEFFLNCAYHRLYYLNQPDQQRSREISLAITNLQQAASWFQIHRNRRESGIPDDSVILDSAPELKQAG